MNVQQVFDLYSSKMTQILLYQRAMQKLAKQELKKLHEFAESLGNNPDLNELSLSHQNMSFRSAKSGENHFFGSITSSIEDRRLAVVLHKNKQYQWLLAEAYEEFADFLENLYSSIGFENNNFWPLRDYGNVVLSELAIKDYEWFQKQAQKKKDVPSSILNRFREHVPSIQNIEANNELGVNLRLAVTLVEYLRHVIVHKGGYVTDKDEFVKLVLQKSGLYNNGNYEENHLDLVRSFFGENEYENTILLIEIATNPEIPLDTYINVFDVLVGYLMAYAHLLQDELNGIAYQTHAV